MTLGERIRLARKSVGMTQTELAGNFITRNMLSKIENDSVYPSLQTLLYISDRLRIPVGEFFTDDDSNSAETRFHEKEIRRLFIDGDSDLCIAVCEKYPETASDEMNLIRSIVYLRRGESNYQNDKIDYAYKDFKSSLFYSARTVYVSADAVRHAKIMIDEIERIKPCPDGLGTVEGSFSGIIPLQNSFEQIFAERVIERTISERNFSAAEKLINDILPSGSIYKRKMRALLEAESGDMKSAAVHLRELAEDNSICAAERYIIWGHLEQIYAYMLDYDEAYICTRTRSDLLRYLQNKNK